jgi:hypothetical protein
MAQISEGTRYMHLQTRVWCREVILSMTEYDDMLVRE